MTIRKYSSFRILTTGIAASAVALTLSASPASAASLSWDPTVSGGTALGGAAGGSWNLSTTNWWNGTSDVAWTDTTGTADTATFAGTAGTVTLGTNLGALGLVFSTTGYTIATGVNTFTLGSSGIDASALTSGTTTISGNLALGASQTWNVGAGATLSASAIVSGTGFGITKSGTGTLILSGANTYTGGTSIGAGIVQIQNNSALGTGTVTLAGGTLRDAGSNLTITNNIVAQASTTSTLDTNGVNFTINGNISGSGNINRGTTSAASVYLGGDNSGFTGTFTNLSSAGGSNNAVVRITNSTAGSAGARWVFNNTNAGKQTLDFGTGTISFGSLTGAGQIQGNIAGTKTLSVGALGLADTFSGIIANGSGTVALTKVGVGTMTLSGANTFTGGVNVNGGELNLGIAQNGTISGPLGASGTISFGGGALQYSAVNQSDYSSRFSTAASQAYSVDTNGQSVTWGTALTSVGGSLAKSGSGTLTLTGANTYNGATSITGGTLLLSGTAAINSSSGITINGSGAKFVQTSSTAGTPAITLTQGTVGGTGTLGAVTVANSAGNVIQNGNGGTATLTLGGLTFNGAGTLSIADSGTTATPGISVTGALITTPASGQVTINASATSWSPLTYDLLGYGSFSGSLSDFTMGTITGLTSRQTASLGLDTINKFVTLIISGDNPRWSGLDSGNWVVGSTGGNSNWKLITSGTATNYIEGDAVFFNDSAEGTTAVNISGANVSPTAVTFNNSTKNYTLSSAGGFGVAGTASLTKTGTGSVTISTVNSYSGGTNINGGTLALSGSGTLGSGTITLGGGTFDLGGSSRTLGAVAITAPAASGNVIQNGTLTPTSLTATHSTGNAIVAATIAGTGGVTMNGTGTLTLSAANTYTGATTINSGTVQLNNANAVQDSVVSIGATNGLTFNNSASGGSSYTIGGLSGASNEALTDISSNAVALTVGNNDNTATYSGVLSGAGSLIKNGIGTQTLSSASTYSGGTTINAGTLIYGDQAALGTGTITLNGGTLKVGTSTNPTLANAISVSSASVLDSTGKNTTLNGNISGAGNLSFTNSGTPVTVALGGDNSGYTGTVTQNNNVAVSFISASAGSAGAAWVFNDATLDRVRINIAGGGTVNLGSLSGSGQIQNDTAGTASSLSVGALGVLTTFSGTMKDGNGTLALIVVGNGLLTLSGTNTYSGGTTVNGGELDTFGTGTLGTGNVTLAAGVTLTLGSTVSFGDNALLTFGTGDTINMNFSGSDILAGISNGTSSIGAGSYTAAQLNAFFGGSTFVDSSALNGTLTVVPEPNEFTLGMVAMLGGMIFIRRRRMIG